MRDAMNGAEFRCTREYLGLPVDWLAWHLEIAERSIRRWENEQGEIPEGVQSELVRIAAETTLFVEHQVRVASLGQDLLVFRRDDAVPEIWRGTVLPHVEDLPASWFRRVGARVLDTLNFDPDANLTWHTA